MRGGAALHSKVNIGQVVKSLSGRDSGRFFLILDIKGWDMVQIVDGELRKLQNPKLKKLKHLMILNKVSENMDKINYNDLQSQNAFIRKELERLGCGNKKEV